MRIQQERFTISTLAVALLAACSSGESTGPSAKVDRSGTPVFVIGDLQAHSVGDAVNFWGAQWGQNNPLSGSGSTPSFKGYASSADELCGGTWTSLPGDSPHPSAAIPEDVLVIVTTNVWKNGPALSGDIKEMILVRPDGTYGPNPGHAGTGRVIRVICPSTFDIL